MHRCSQITENLLIYVNVNSANLKQPEDVKTGSVAADKAQAALNGSGTWSYPTSCLDKCV